MEPIFSPSIDMESEWHIIIILETDEKKILWWISMKWSFMFIHHLNEIQKFYHIEIEKFNNCKFFKRVTIFFLDNNNFYVILSRYIIIFLSLMSFPGLSTYNNKCSTIIPSQTTLSKICSTAIWAKTNVSLRKSTVSWFFSYVS